MKKIDRDIKFIPLKNLTSDEMMELLKESKVYIDFGYFPGPERIPREAVSCYCNLITSDVGSANNEFDIPISGDFKFARVNENIDDICQLIIKQVYNYSDYVNYFDKYREKVKNNHKNLTII